MKHVSVPLELILKADEIDLQQDEVNSLFTKFLNIQSIPDHYKQGVMDILFKYNIIPSYDSISSEDMGKYNLYAKFLAFDAILSGRNFNYMAHHLFEKISESLEKAGNRRKENLPEGKQQIVEKIMLEKIEHAFPNYASKYQIAFSYNLDWNNFYGKIKTNIAAEAAPKEKTTNIYHTNIVLYRLDALMELTVEMFSASQNNLPELPKEIWQ